MIYFQSLNSSNIEKTLDHIEFEYVQKINTKHIYVQKIKFKSHYHPYFNLKMLFFVVLVFFE